MIISFQSEYIVSIHKNKDIILLMGFMGSGKSTVGKLLAELLDFDFIDLDYLLEENQQMTVAEIFEVKGEKYFRVLESQVLANLVSCKHTVVSLGGGTPCSQKNIETIKDLGLSIYLKMDTIALMNRLIGEQHSRPLIKAFQDEQQLSNFIEGKIAERKKYYEQADFIIDGEGSPKEVVENIICLLEEAELP